MKSYSMRASLLITIVAMGLLTVGFTLFSGEIYLEQTLDNWRESFTEVAELEVHNRWDKLKQEASSLSLSIQSSKTFRKALAENNHQAMSDTLNEHFHRAYVTLGILDLKKLIVYDNNLSRISQSSEGEQTSDDICPAIFTEARQRKGAQRFKTLHHVCEFHGQLRLVTMVPVGGLRLLGYLLTVINPIATLAKAEEGIGIPVMIKSKTGEILFKSINWPEDKAIKQVMLVHYGNKAGNSKAVAHFYFASDVTELKQKLFATRLSLIIFVVLTTLLAITIAMSLFRKTIIKPLSSITEHFNKIRFDKKYLDDDINIKGSKELENLASELNSISTELSRLYREFESMAFTDSLTGIPNRALLFDRLKQITLFAKRDKSQSEFMLMMMDLNKFKAVNDELGHHVGDQLLVAVADRLKQALRESDTVARLGGDEFSIILYAVNDKQVAKSVADKITASMNELFAIEGYKIEVGMSIGIARYPHDGNNSEEIMHSADMAMYHAKRNKLPYVFYESLVE